MVNEAKITELLLQQSNEIEAIRSKFKVLLAAQGYFHTCARCVYWKQGPSHVICGHPDANMQGRGGYTYYNLRCDIDKFQPR